MTPIDPHQISSEPSLLQRVRRFVDEEVLPRANDPAREAVFPEELVERMRQLGLFGSIIPQQYGGLGQTLSAHAEMMAAIARGWVSVAGVLNTHNLCCRLLVDCGTEEQRATLLPAMASGRLRAAISLTEPDAGSDLRAITCRADRDGSGEWRLAGRKRWVTNGLGAGLVFVLVTSEAGATCFITRKEPWAKDSPPPHAGLRIDEIIDKMGDRGVETTDVVYDGYRCRDGDILGGETGLGQGLAQVLSCMEAGRIGASAMCVGLVERCLEISIRYAKARRAFGKPIADHQAIQFKVADMATKLEAARLLVREAAETKDAGQRADLQAGMAKLFASEAAKEAAEDAFRIHGSNGYSKSCEAERLFRDALSLIAAEGTSEIQRLIIGRSIFRTGV